MDTISESMEIRKRLLKILYGVWDHIKNHGDYGAENLWMSDPLREASSACLKLSWESSVEIGSVHLTFDTMIREQRFFDRPLLGPVPTCVRDCTVEYSDENGNWLLLDKIENNFLRHRILHTAAPVRTRSIRFRVDHTQGDAHARIYEVRIYP